MIATPTRASARTCPNSRSASCGLSEEVGSSSSSTARGPAQRAGRGDELLVADRRGRRAAWPGSTESPTRSQQRLCGLPHRFGRSSSPSAREAGLVAEIDVLGEREVGHQLEFLADDAEPLVEGIADRGEAGPPGR